MHAQCLDLLIKDACSSWPVGSVVGVSAYAPKVSGSIPHQGCIPGKFAPPCPHPLGASVGGIRWMYLSHMHVSLSPPPSCFSTL